MMECGATSNLLEELSGSNSVNGWKRMVDVLGRNPATDFSVSSTDFMSKEADITVTVHKVFPGDLEDFLSSSQTGGGGGGGDHIH